MGPNIPRSIQLSSTRSRLSQHDGAKKCLESSQSWFLSAFLELPPGRFAADPVLGSHCFNVTMVCVQGERVSANWTEHLEFYERLDAVSYSAVWRTGSDGRWLTTKVHFFTTKATPGMFWNLPGSVSAPSSMKETIKRTTRRRRRRLRNRTGLMDGCSTTRQTRC